MTDAMQRLVTGRPARRTVTERALDISAPTTATIIRWGADGAYCTPLMGDLRLVSTDQVLGPCRGGLVRDLRTCADAAHTHAAVPLPVGTVVLVVPTAGGLWITRHDSTTSGGL
jgi:hypothetical protein